MTVPSRSSFCCAGLVQSKTVLMVAASVNERVIGEIVVRDVSLTLISQVKTYPGVWVGATQERVIAT